MGIDPVTLAIAGGLGALSVVEANQQNRRVQKAAEAQKATQDVAAQQRREATARELQALEGSILATSAGRGVAGSASSAALSLATFESAAQQAANIEMNRYFSNIATQSQGNAQMSSPLMAGISGFSTGLQLGGSFGGADPTAAATSSGTGAINQSYKTAGAFQSTNPFI
jgi:hypothetical protein